MQTKDHCTACGEPKTNINKFIIRKNGSVVARCRKCTNIAQLRYKRTYSDMARVYKMQRIEAIRQQFKIWCLTGGEFK